MLKAQLRLQVDGPAAYDHSQFIIKGDAIRITVQNTNATDVCIFIDATRHCSTDRVIQVSAWRRHPRHCGLLRVMKGRRWSLNIPAEELTTRPLPEPHRRTARAAPPPLKRRPHTGALTNTGAPLAKFNFFKDGSSVGSIMALAGINLRARAARGDLRRTLEELLSRALRRP